MPGGPTLAPKCPSQTRNIAANSAFLLMSRTCQLRLCRVAVVPVGFHQLGVGAALNDAALLQDQHAVALPQCAEAMSNDECRAAPHRVLHGAQNFMLGVRIDRSRRIV